MSTTITNRWDKVDRAQLRRRIVNAMTYASGIVILSIGALAILLVAAATGFRAPRLYREVMARALSRLGLWMVGIRVVEHHPEPLPAEQVIYVSNHSSRIDFFVLTALGLPNTRFFLSGYLRRILPLAVIGYISGVFWTVRQKYRERRVKIFQRAERVLRRSGESVYCSPEGIQGMVGTIAPFNKGAFHLATNLGAPIVPFFIHIPRQIDPGWDYDFRAGTVHVYFQPAIATRDWRLADLDQNRQRIREYFVELDKQYHGQRS